MSDQFKTVPTPLTAGQGMKPCLDWRRLAMELKALPEGQAKEVTIPGVGTHPHQTVSGALKKEGVKVHVCKITGRTVLIWENRNDAA